MDDTDKFQQWLLEEFDADGDTVMITPGEGFYATPGMEPEAILEMRAESSEKLKNLLPLAGFTTQ